jgi:quercetin dioxygenase-like cupin family protein
MQIDTPVEPSMSRPVVVRIGQLEVRYLIDGSAREGLGLFELTVPPGSNVPPPHSHTRNEECVYVLDGILRYSVDGVTRDLRPGEWMRTPRGSVHGFGNPHAEKARALVTLSPDIGVQYFRDVARIVNAGGSSVRTELLAVMARHGLVPAPPRS